MANSAINPKTKKKADAKKRTESAIKKTPKKDEIKTDIFEEEYRFQWS